MITQLSQPLLEGTHQQIAIIIRKNEDDNLGQGPTIAVRIYPTAIKNHLTDEQVNAVSKGYLITGTPEELEKSIPVEFRDYTDAIVDGAKQLADIQAEIEKAKKPKATTKAKAKPKAKTNAEKVADQRKKQIEESQKKAKETLQSSLDLGADRLDDNKEDAEDIMKKAQEVDI
jgi:hypothetical protein